MLNEKKISKSGSITIPLHIRRKVGIAAGEKMKVNVDYLGNLILKRVGGSCLMCQTHEEIVKIDRIYLCRSCGKKIQTELEKGE